MYSAKKEKKIQDKKEFLWHLKKSCLKHLGFDVSALWDFASLNQWKWTFIGTKWTTFSIFYS